MTVNEFITRLLDINQPMSDNPVRFSTIVLLIKGARKLSGCNIITGKYEMNEINEESFSDLTYHSFQYTGLINYLILLEQLGGIFKPINKDKIEQTNGIFCSLKYFTNLEENKIKAIKALRNSLAHKFGLATEKSPGIKPPMKFIISIERNNEVIKLPNEDWNGDFTDKTLETSTTIYLIDLIELVEKVFFKIIKEHQDNNLELILKDGINELMTRFTIIY